MENKINVAVSMKSEIEKDSIFCPTISIAFKEFFENILKNNFSYCGKNPEIKNIESDLQNLEINKDIYYVKSGQVSLKLKMQIEKDIKKKFNEKSELLSFVDFEKESEMILIYAMLKLALEFKNKFEELEQNSFNNSPNKVNYFGYLQGADKAITKQVYPMFYENENEFACSVNAKNGKVVLYRTDEILPFETMYQRCMSKTDNFDINTKLVVKEFKVPELNVKVLKQFNDLENEKFFCNSNLQEYLIDKVFQQITFELNNSGAKVKSEVLMMIAKCCLDRRKIVNKSFVFDKPFYLFMFDDVSSSPVLCLRVDDINKFTK